VEHFDVPARVPYQPRVLQSSGRHRNTLSTPAQHACDELLRHDQLARFDAIVTQQDPAAEPLFYRMHAIANRGLADLRNECLCVQQEHVLQRSAASELLE